MMDETTLDDYYADAESSFKEVYAAVICKMSQGIEPTTAKEKAMFNFVKEWADTFGASSAISS